MLGVWGKNGSRIVAVDQALREVPAFVHFWSAEPLIDEVDALPLWEQHGKPDWLIIGGESGPKSRPCNLEWVRSLVSQCKKSKVACFVKQLGAKPQECDGGCRQEAASDGGTSAPLLTLQLLSRKGGDIEEWPKELRVRKFPKVRTVRGVNKPKRGPKPVEHATE